MKLLKESRRRKFFLVLLLQFSEILIAVAARSKASVALERSKIKVMDSNPVHEADV
jgi:hypothetical protein